MKHAMTTRMTIMTITPASPYITPLSSDDADEPPTRPPVDNSEAGVGCQVCVWR